MRQLQTGIEGALSHLVVGAGEQSYLLVVLHQAGLHDMGGVTLLQVDEFGTDIADGTVLVGHVTNCHITGHRKVTTGIEDDVIVALQHTCHAGSIGDDGGHLMQVEAVETDGDVLQGGGVCVLGIDLHTHAIVSHQVDLRTYAVVSTQEEVVVGIETELLIAQGRPFGNEVEVQATVEHLGLGTYACTQLVVGIVVANAKGGATLLQQTIEEGVEHKLRVLLVVTYLTTKGEVVLTLGQTEIDGIEAYVADGQRVDIAIAIDSCRRGGGHVEEHVTEVDALAAQHDKERVLALALHMHLHDGEQTTQGGLVDDLRLQLGCSGITQGRQLAQQSFVVTTDIEFDDKVATLCAQQGRVGGGIQVDAHKLRADGA